MTAMRSVDTGERHGPERSTAHRRAGRGSGAGTAPGTASGRGIGIGIRIGSRRVPVSTLLLLDVVVLCLIGLVMVGSASSVVSIATYGSPWAILIRETMWMAIGGIALWLAVRFDYRKLRRFSPLIMLVTFGLLFVVLVPGLGVHAMGSSRWVGFGQFRLQPSELMKLALTLFAADFITRRLDEDSADRRIIGPLLIVTGLACVLILVQPDMGTAMVLGFIALALLFVSGVRLRPVMKVTATLAGLALLVAVASPYRRARLLSFMDPSAHSSGSGYQVMQSVIGLGSGHFVGAGLGGGQAQWGFLPNADTDFIFSVIGEELGIVGALAGAVPPRRVHLVRHTGGRAIAGPLRRAGLARTGGVGGCRDPHQRRGGGGRAARHRDPAALHLLRRVLVGHHHGGRRRADQRGPAGRGRWSAPGGRLGPPAHERGPAAGRRARPEVGERTARHGDRGRRDGRSHRSLAADRPRAGCARASGRVDRALRLSPGTGGHRVADPRVPAHPAAGPGGAPQPAPVRLVGQRGCGVRFGVGLRARLGLLSARRPRVVVIVGATPASRRGWRRCSPGCRSCQ